MIHRSVFCQQLRLAVAGVVRVRKAKMDQEGSRAILRLPIPAIVKDLSRVLSAAGIAGFRGVPSHSEQLIGGFVAVPPQLGLDPHRLEVPGHKRLEIDFGSAIREIID